MALDMPFQDARLRANRATCWPFKNKV